MRAWQHENPRSSPKGNFLTLRIIGPYLSVADQMYLNELLTQGHYILQNEATLRL